MDCRQPGSSSMKEIFQARILEWVAISFFRMGSSQPRGWTPSPALQMGSLLFEGMSAVCQHCVTVAIKLNTWQNSFLRELHCPEKKILSGQMIILSGQCQWSFKRSMWLRARTWIWIHFLNLITEWSSVRHLLCYFEIILCPYYKTGYFWHLLPVKME